jgi:hypothetical protein
MIFKYYNASLNLMLIILSRQQLLVNLLNMGDIILKIISFGFKGKAYLTI